MRIALSLQYNSDFAEIAAITVPVIERYALRHGYSVFINKCELSSPEICWQRLKDAEMLLPRYDSVVHLDCDMLITNPEVKIEDIIAESVGSFFCGTDVNGVNDGFCGWKNDAGGRRMLAWQAQRVAEGIEIQDAITQAEQWPFYTVTKLPQRRMNSYLYAEYGMTYPEGEWKAGDFLMHLPGIGNDRRMEILRERVRTPELYKEAVSLAMENNGPADGTWNLRMRTALERRGLKLGERPPPDFGLYPEGCPYPAPAFCDDEPHGWPTGSYILWK